MLRHAPAGLAPLASLRAPKPRSTHAHAQALRTSRAAVTQHSAFSGRQVARALPGGGCVGACSALLSPCPRATSARSSRAALRVTALVNVDFGPGTLLGLLLIGSGVALYQVRAVRPEVSRDYDVFFSSLGLLCGGILVFQGWRLDPLLFFGQLLTAGSALSFGVEAVRLRGELRDSKDAAAPPGTPGGRRRRRGRGSEPASALPQPGAAPRYGRWAGEDDEAGAWGGPAGGREGEGREDDDEAWRRFRQGDDDAWSPRGGGGGGGAEAREARRRGATQQTQTQPGGAFREAFESERRAPGPPPPSRATDDAARGGAEQWGGRTQDWE